MAATTQLGADPAFRPLAFRAAGVISLVGGMPAALLASGPFDLVAPADVHPATVGLLASVAVVGALALARVLRLPRIASHCLPVTDHAPAVIAELAELAELARSGGLLPTVADDRLHRFPVLRSGLYLLIRDADEALLRSALEAEMDRANQAGAARARTRAITCRVAGFVLLVAAAAGALVLASAANHPARIQTAPAGSALAAILLGFVALSVCGSVARRCEQRNVGAAFARLAELHTVEAIRSGDDRAAAAARLARLLPESGSNQFSDAIVARRAA